MDSIYHHTCPRAYPGACANDNYELVVLIKPGSLKKLPKNSRCTCKYPKVHIPEAISFFLWNLSIISGNLHLVWIDAWNLFELNQFVPQLQSKNNPFTFTAEICYWGLRDGIPVVKINCTQDGIEHEYSVFLTSSSCGISRSQMLEILTSQPGILVYRTGFMEEAYRRLRPQMSTAVEAYILADSVAEKLTKEQIQCEARIFTSTLFDT
jgi:hypothetical protein